MRQLRLLFLGISVLLLIGGSSCSCRRTAPDWERFSPAVRVVLQEDSGVARVFVQKLAFGAVKNGLAVETAQYGFTNLSKRSIDLALNYQSLPEKPERIRIKLSVKCDDKQFDLPEVVWNLREEMQVASGAGWSVVLVPHYEEPKGAIPGDQLDWDAMKAEYERTGQPPAELILKKE